MLASLWPSLSYEARQQVVKELVERIDVGEDSLHFVFFYSPSFAPAEKGSHISTGAALRYSCAKIRISSGEGISRRI
jgi:site-specific DNA recombinase